jgi:hypothetical protein
MLSRLYLNLSLIRSNYIIIDELLGLNQDLRNRNQELEQETKRLKEFLSAKVKSKGSYQNLRLIF